MFYEMHEDKNHFILASFIILFQTCMTYFRLWNAKGLMKMWFSSIIKVRMLRFKYIHIFTACFRVK